MEIPQELIAVLYAAIGALLLKIAEWLLTRGRDNHQRYIDLGDQAFKRNEEYIEHLQETLAGLQETVELYKSQVETANRRYYKLMESHQTMRLELNVMYLQFVKLADKYGEEVPPLIRDFALSGKEYNERHKEENGNQKTLDRLNDRWKDTDLD